MFVYKFNYIHNKLFLVPIEMPLKEIIYTLKFPTWLVLYNLDEQLEMHLEPGQISNL